MDLADPQQIHGYNYADNNPATWDDPTGLCLCWTVDGIHVGGTISTPTSGDNGSSGASSSGSFTWQNNWACVDYCGSPADNWLREQGGAQPTLGGGGGPRGGDHRDEGAINNVIIPDNPPTDIDALQADVDEFIRGRSPMVGEMNSILLARETVNALLTLCAIATGKYDCNRDFHEGLMEIWARTTDWMALWAAGLSAAFNGLRVAARGLVRGPGTVSPTPQFLRVGDVRLPAVPRGAVGTVTDKGKGLRYNIPAGTPELHPSVASVRIMNPVVSGKYTYPNGYASYMNAGGQTIHPLTGQTLSRSHPFAHIPLR